MPDADTVWLTPLEEMLSCLECGRAGRLLAPGDCSAAHGTMAEALYNAFAADAERHRRSRSATLALEELLAAHRLWSVWLRESRVRKFAVVAEKTDALPGS